MHDKNEIIIFKNLLKKNINKTEARVKNIFTVYHKKKTGEGYRAQYKKSDQTRRVWDVGDVSVFLGTSLFFFSYLEVKVS